MLPRMPPSFSPEPPWPQIGSSSLCDEVAILDAAGHLSRAAPRSLLGGGRARRLVLGLTPSPREVCEALAPEPRSSGASRAASVGAAHGGGQRFSAVAVDWVLAAGLATHGGAAAVLAAMDPAEPASAEPGLVDIASLEAAAGGRADFSLRVVAVDTTLPGGGALSEAMEGRAWLSLRLHSRLETLATAGRVSAGALKVASFKTSGGSTFTADGSSISRGTMRVLVVERTRSGRVRRFHESIVVSLGTLASDGGWLAELEGRSVDVDQDTDRASAAAAAAAAAAGGQVGAMQAAWASGKRRSTKPASGAAAAAGAGSKQGEMTSGSVRAVPRTAAPAEPAEGGPLSQGSPGQVDIRTRSSGRDAVVLPFKASAINAGRNGGGSAGAAGGAAQQGIGTLAPRAAPSGLIEVDLGDDGGSGGSSDDSDSSGDDDDDEGMLV